MLWVCSIALAATLAAVALAPERPGPNVRVVREAELRAPGEAPRVVALTHHGSSTLSAAGTTTFRVRIPVPTRPSADAAIDSMLLTSAFPNMLVRMGGRDIYATHTPAQMDRLESTSALRPHLIALPTDGSTLAGPAREIELVLRARPREAVGLNPVWFGPHDELHRAFKSQEYLRWTGLHALIAVYALTALTALAFWIADPSYASPGWFAGFCGFASIAMWLGMSVEAPWVSWPLLLHAAMFLVGVSSLCLAQFVLDKTGRRTRASDRVLASAVAAIAALGALMYSPQVPFPYALVIDAACVLLGIWLVVSLVRTVRERRDPLDRVLLGGVGLSLLFGLHSVAAGWLPGFYASAYSLQFAPLPLTVAMAWVVVRRYARMKRRADAQARRLKRRVALRESQLGAAFASIQAFRDAEAVQRERERMTRDMHDGLGAQLIASLHLADRRSLTSEAMRETLQMCLDELRFSIESLKPTAGDWQTVLGNFRYRLQPRLDAVGISLAWSVDDAGAPAADAGAVVQVLRMLNEMVANALKHSGTRRLAIDGRPEAGGYTLAVRDWGVGFDPASVRVGDGLENLRRRASFVGATVSFERRSPGMVVLLRWPDSTETTATNV